MASATEMGMIEFSERLSYFGIATSLMIYLTKALSRSRLDLFYWLLAGISAANLGFYVLVAIRYSYKQQTAKAGRVGVEKDVAGVNSPYNHKCVAQGSAFGV
ncbi:hypothetical protein TRIUR3_08440 [Triticum urartu]|uniref:Uncharacterized protein n=1 Tax=Triticum urartu TaxID=4572 RepID=M7Z7Z0_TRIUA|nr:hypothetical protein TRIUR3_08440 [Triticum urartu]